MTATTHTDIRPLSSDETDSVSGGFANLGMAIATSIALQQVPPAGPPTNIGPSRSGERYAKTVFNYIKG